MNRREMLKGLGATVGVGWAAAAKAAGQSGVAGPAESRSGDMIYRTLGRTGRRISAFGGRRPFCSSLPTAYCLLSPASAQPPPRAL